MDIIAQKQFACKIFNWVLEGAVNGWQDSLIFFVRKKSDSIAYPSHQF